MTRADGRRLVCPACRGRLRFVGAVEAGQLHEGELRCRCGRRWPVRDGLPRLVDEAAVRGLDRFMRVLYDHLAVLHDPAARVLLPVLQLETEATSRDRYMRRLALNELAPPRGRRPLRILEVGVGGGANLPLIERDLPRGLSVELWGLDLSEGMIRQCQRRLRSHRGRPLRLLLADAHALPFADASFDRVFHVGGIAAFRDPRCALAELGRVAKPNTPIVVVDEQLDPHRAHNLYFRAVFRALTFYDGAPACPRHLLPPGATDVIEEQVSRFYYALTFRMPPRDAAARVRRVSPQVGAQGGEDRPRLHRRRVAAVHLAP